VRLGERVVEVSLNCLKTSVVLFLSPHLLRVVVAAIITNGEGC
jgi:hypothetical protein